METGGSHSPKTIRKNPHPTSSTSKQPPSELSPRTRLQASSEKQRAESNESHDKTKSDHATPKTAEPEQRDANKHVDRNESEAKRKQSGSKIKETDKTEKTSERAKENENENKKSKEKENDKEKEKTRGNRNQSEKAKENQDENENEKVRENQNENEKEFSSQGDPTASNSSPTTNASADGYTEENLIRLVSNNKVTFDIKVAVLKLTLANKIPETWFTYVKRNKSDIASVGWKNSVVNKQKFAHDLFVGRQMAIEPEFTKSRWATGWQPASIVINDRLRYWCHGFSLDTYDIDARLGYSIFGADVMETLRDSFDRITSGSFESSDNFRKMPEGKIQSGDVVLFMSNATPEQIQHLTDWKTKEKTSKFIKDQPDGLAWATKPISKFWVSHSAKIDNVEHTNGYLDIERTTVLEKPTAGRLRRYLLEQSRQEFAALDVSFWRRKPQSKAQLTINNLDYIDKLEKNDPGITKTKKKAALIKDITDETHIARYFRKEAKKKAKALDSSKSS